MDDSKSLKSSWHSETLLVLLSVAAISISAAVWFHRQGYVLYYGDAQAHLNIARRIFDSRTPGYEQIGTAWLPLPHLLMLPFVWVDSWWQSGLAGTIPAAASFILAVTLLFFAARRIFGSRAAAVAVAAVCALNPNLLYLQSVPMTESIFLAALCGLLYATTAYSQTQSRTWVWVAGLAALAGSLTRYEGWLLIPFVALFFLLSAKQHRFLLALGFIAIASLGPLYWLGHNRWFYGNPLEFYSGPYSAMAIYQQSLSQGMQPYPGDGDWTTAAAYLLHATWLCAGAPLVLLGILGSAVALVKRKIWPLVLLLLPPAFVVWSMHSSGTPIFVPHLWPNSYYNTHYGLAVLPLLALSVGALVAWTPLRLRAMAGVAVILIVTIPWLISPSAEDWICWKEAAVNSEARRAWTDEAAHILRVNYREGEGIITTFGDLTGIFPKAGIALRETLHQGNEPMWEAAVARPELFLMQGWAVTTSADKVATAILRAGRDGPRYHRVKTITVKGAPVIEIYRRDQYQ